MCKFSEQRSHILTQTESAETRYQTVMMINFSTLYHNHSQVAVC